MARPEAQAAGTANWVLFGPTAVVTPTYGQVTGRVSALALDPADSTGNRLYLGTTGGGVWVAENAGAQDPSKISFTSLSDNMAAFNGAQESSISIGALAVQPGGTGVILAGTGDPNDVMDSYYGAGILRSADGGTTWTLIQSTADQLFSFVGEGFAGFAFSTADPQLVVAAVSQAYEGALVDAERRYTSYEGLYYSNDGGASWSLARITDPSGDVQGMGDPSAGPFGNAATSVVWNPVRQRFIAAVRFHGYYQSTDGVTWTRLAAQPGAGLTSALCPTSAGSIGSHGCPIYRGTLAVNPMTGDTFAWTVDMNWQDQGLWQDQCNVSANACAGKIAFTKQWSTASLETNTRHGAATIENGDYNLVLAAVPAAQGLGADTILLAGANDLWKCSLAMGCAWRNTTNAFTCMSAKVAGYQHALAWNLWNLNNPLEVFAGNDGGIWRSADAIGETGQVCAASDAAHFQNLNGGLGSLAEVESFAQSAATPYTMMAGLGANGTAAVKSTSGTATQWPLVLSGNGGPVVINPQVAGDWYVNTQAGVSIYACTQGDACTPDAFGTSPVVNDADVGGDGGNMPTPAPFLVDALDATQLLIGTCRVWRGPANGLGWPTNAISPILDGGAGSSCQGDSLIRSMAAMALGDGSEVIYVGMYGGDLNGNLAGHVLKAIFKPGGRAPDWRPDLTLNPVAYDSKGLNFYGLDISSIVIDTHDPTGNTVYVTVAGFASPPTQDVKVLYRSTDGGKNWAFLTSNLPPAPANSLVVDPQDACTVYIATDAGVYSTRNVSSCANKGSTCWTAYGAGLPGAPVVELSAAGVTSSAQLLSAATYGRGIWQTPEWTAGTLTTTATVSPASLAFPSQFDSGGSSAPEPVSVTNTGSAPLRITSIVVTGNSADFSFTGCESATLQPGEICTIQVTFTPAAAGARAGTLAVGGNVSCNQLNVALSGTGIAPPVSLEPAAISFDGVLVGTTSAPTRVTVTNNSAGTVSFPSAFTVSGPFVLAGNTCAGATLVAGAPPCLLDVEFSPTASGGATGAVSLGYQSGSLSGTRTVALSGTGQAAATDTLSATALSFQPTIAGQLSDPQTVTLTNSGDVRLTSISAWTSAGYQTSNNCGSALNGHASCTISVVFVPSQAGSQPGTLSVYDLQRTQTVALTGSGLQPPVLSVSPTALSFAAQLVGQSSAPTLLTVSNTGGAPMANVGFQFMGVSAGSFQIGATTCGATLGNGGSCTVQVIFKPAVTGGSVATLVVSSSSPGVAAVPVPLSGTGIAPGAISVSPPQISFQIVTPGQTTAPKGVFITNTGAGSLSVINLAVNPPFSVAQTTCTGSLAAGSSCSAGVVFSPAVNGNFSGVLSVSSPGLLITASVALSGIGGVPGTLQAQPGIVNFPVTGMGATSDPVTVTLTNPGNALTNLKLGATGAFSVASSACPDTLVTQSSCTATVVFSPVSAGPQTGSMTVTSDGLAAGDFLPLHGVGFDFTVTPPPSLSQTVVSGQTASFPLGFSLVNQTKEAVLTLSCNTAPPFPPYASCSFNPSANPKVPATASGNATVIIATGQSRTTARLTGWRMVSLACGLTLLPLTLMRRRRAFLLVFLLAFVVGGVSSCTSSGVYSGGGTPRSGPGITPPATYKIPVDVVSNNVKHTITLTLIVD